VPGLPGVLRIFPEPGGPIRLYGPSMRFLCSSFVALALTALVACSESSPGQRASGTSDSGGPGGSGSGGRSTGSGGGRSSGGTTGTGGFDPAVAKACGVDAGVDACRGCLAVKCCAAAQACFADKKCTASFDPYRTCVKTTPDDVSRCYSDFARAVLGDAHSHEALLNCIAIGGCEVCGGPSVL
jgi:hypothetical protein